MLQWICLVNLHFECLRLGKFFWEIQIFTQILVNQNRMFENFHFVNNQNFLIQKWKVNFVRSKWNHFWLIKQTKYYSTYWIIGCGDLILIRISFKSAKQRFKSWEIIIIQYWKWKVLLSNKNEDFIERLDHRSYYSELWVFQWKISTKWVKNPQLTIKTTLRNQNFINQNSKSWNP